MLPKNLFNYSTGSGNGAYLLLGAPRAIFDCENEITLFLWLTPLALEPSMDARL